jgi:hypothetical protein
MAKKTPKALKKPTAAPATEIYEHKEATVLLRPDVGTQAQFKQKKPAQRYRYDSSLAPALDWDGQNSAREQGEALIAQILDISAKLKAAAGDEERAALSAKLDEAARGALLGAHKLVDELQAPTVGWALVSKDPVALIVEVSAMVAKCDESCGVFLEPDPEPHEPITLPRGDAATMYLSITPVNNFSLRRLFMTSRRQANLLKAGITPRCAINCRCFGPGTARSTACPMC